MTPDSPLSPDTADGDVRYGRSGAVARIAVNRPDRLNAYRDATADALRAALARAEADAEVRAVVLTGEGRAFGAGYDLTQLEGQAEPDLGTVLGRHFNPLVQAMRASRLPIVAAVNGPCAGAAVGVALAADIVIAGRSAFFLEPFTGIALVPDAGNTLFLTRAMGRIRASGMMLLGDRIPAAQALDWGLLWQVVEDEELDAAALALAERLACKPAAAMAATKALIRAAAETDLDARLDHERDLQDALGRGPAMKEAVAAFLASRG